MLLSVLGVLPCAVLAEEVQAPRIEYSAIQPTSGGVNVYVAGKWGVLNLEVVNPRHEPQELLSTTYFEGRPTLQFGRRIWVPARSRLRTWQPVLPPEDSGKALDRFEYHSLVLKATADADVAARDDTGRVLHSGLLPAHREKQIVGLLENSDDSPSAGADGNTARELVACARMSQKLSTRVVSPRDQDLLPDDVCLLPLNHLIIADSRVIGDSAGLAAIRRWTHGGGWLWVMMDRVGPEVMERLFGDEFECTVIDRVGLTTVTIEKATDGRGELPPGEEHEQPVDFVRVLMTGAEVRYRVNGWPAAIWKTFGEGRILMTTLAPRGWMRLKTAQDTDSQDFGTGSNPATTQGDSSRFAALPSLADTAKDFFQHHNAAPEIVRPLERQAGEYIGYSIPSRRLVVGLLGGFVATVAILGVWLWRKNVLEQLGWISPCLAICFTAVLLIIGGLNRHIIPATAAAVGLIEVVPGTDDIRSQGAVAFYNPESGPAEIGSLCGGRLIPDLAGLEGTTRRMVWNDLDSWNWENLRFGGGERLAKFEQSETMYDRIEARGTFGPDGFSGQLSLPGLAGAEDAIMATRMGRIGVKLQPNGAFRAAAADVFSPQQFLAADLLSDEQDRRRRTYSQVIPELLRERSVGDPLLLLWGSRHATAFQFDEGRRLLGASLVAIPLKIDRPPGATHVRIPAPFLPFRNVPQPDGSPSAAIWDHNRLEWQERSSPGTAWLRFQLPASLLPMELTRARLVITVAGPVGRVALSGLRRRVADPGSVGAGAASRHNDVVAIKTWNAPVGTLPETEILEPDLLWLDHNGGFVLGLSAGDPAEIPPTDPLGSDGGKVSYWKIERLSLELSGTVSP